MDITGCSGHNGRIWNKTGLYAYLGTESHNKTDKDQQIHYGNFMTNQY